MAVKLAKHNHSNALQIYDAGAEKAESDTGGEIAKDAWYYLVWSFELVNRGADTQVEFFINNGDRAPNRHGQTHS